MEQLRPNAQRAKTAILFLYIIIACNTALLISDYMQYVLLEKVKSGAFFTTMEGTANDTRQRIIAVIYIVAYILSGIAFIRWFRRAYFNLHMKARVLEYSESAALWNWFIPIVCLFRPYKIMVNMFTETNALLAARQKPDLPETNITLVGWWWTLWIAGNIIGQFDFRYGMRAETIDELIISTLISIFTFFISVPAALMAIQVIRNYSAAEAVLDDSDDRPLSPENTADIETIEPLPVA